MNRDKQIEEMAKDLCNGVCSLLECMPDKHCTSWKYAETAVNKDYRKASEVAREIFEEIEQKMNALYKSVQYGCYSYMRYGSIATDSPQAQRQMGKLEGVKHLGDVIAELKKKYTEGEG